MTLLRLPFFAFLFLFLYGQLSAEIVHPNDRIVFIGDSITGEGGAVKHGWVAHIRQALQRADAENAQTLVPLGGSGQTVGSWLNVEKRSREKSVILNVKEFDVRQELDQSADIVVIMLGMNDVLSTGLANTPAGIDKWTEQYRALIDVVRGRTTPRVLALATPTPCTEDPMCPKNIVMDQLVLAMTTLAEEENCILLPTRELAWQLLAAGRKLKPDFHFLMDQVHPNSAGHAMIAAGMLKGLGEAELADGLFEQALKLGGADTNAGFSYALTQLSPSIVARESRFQLDVFNHKQALEFDLPEGWGVKTLETDQAQSRYELTAVLNRAVNRMVIHSGELSQTIEIPAPWLVGTGNIGWGGWKQGVYDAELGYTPSDDFVRLGKGFENQPFNLELKEGAPISWSTFIGNVNYGGEGDPDILDFAQVTYYRGGEVGYGLRWVYSPIDRPIGVKVSQAGFSGNNYVQLWLNGDLVYVGHAKKAKGELFEAALRKGWNLLSFKSNFFQWQWQLSVGFSGLSDDRLDELRYSVLPPR